MPKGLRGMMSRFGSKSAVDQQRILSEAGLYEFPDFTEDPFDAIAAEQRVIQGCLTSCLVHNAPKRITHQRESHTACHELG
jgi:hypothetical protein